MSTDVGGEKTSGEYTGDSLEDAEKELEELLENLESAENYSGKVFNGEKDLWRDGEELLGEKAGRVSDTAIDPLLQGLQNSSIEKEEEEEMEEEEEESFDFDEEEDFDEEDLDPTNWEQTQKDDLTEELQKGQQPASAAEHLEEAMEYSPFMGQLGQLAIEKADYWRAALCAYISGEEIALFVSDKRQLELLKLAVKDYLSYMKVSQPSPFVRLLVAIGAWALPSLVMAYFMRRGRLSSNSGHAPKSATKMEVVREEIVRNSPYQHLKEYQDGRTSFKVHSNKAKPIGAYQYSPDGKTYRSVQLANEEPSSVIATWLAEGKDNSFIKAQLYGN